MTNGGKREERESERTGAVLLEGYLLEDLLISRMGVTPKSPKFHTHTGHLARSIQPLVPFSPPNPFFSRPITPFLK